MNVDYTESTIMMIRKQLHRLIHNSVQQFQAAEKAIQKAEERKRKREQASVWFVQDDDLLQSADHQSVLVVIKSALKNETELILRERFLLSDLIAVSLMSRSIVKVLLTILLLSFRVSTSD